jgi:hypothetical protein
VGEAFVALDGPAPETEIVRDMVKRAAYAAPVLIVVFGLIWGINGAVSTGYAIAVVVVNFIVAAALDSMGARISVGMLMGMSLFGFFIRMAIVFGAFFAAKDAAWMSVIPFAFTLVITHLGLLFWEMRYVSANLAHPGLKPKAAASGSSSVIDVDRPAAAPLADPAPAQKEF